MTKKYLVIFIVILMAVTIFIGIKWANSSTKVINVVPAPGSEITSNENSEPISINTIWFKTLIPAGYKQDTYTEDMNSTTKLQAVYVGNNINKGQIAISLKAIPKEGISGVSDYNLRLNDKTKYNEVSYGGWPVAAKTFTNLNSFETSVFWINNSLYATISASGPDNTKPATNVDLGSILDQWHWY